MNGLRYASPFFHDLDEIVDYIAVDNPDAAQRLADRIEQECIRIADNPTRGLRHEDLQEELLVCRVFSYLIIYRPEVTGVLILRVIHGARNLHWISVADE